MTNAVRDPLSQARLDVASAAIARLDAKIRDFERRQPDIASRVRVIYWTDHLYSLVMSGARIPHLFPGVEIRIVKGRPPAWERGLNQLWKLKG